MTWPHQLNAIAIFIADNSVFHHQITTVADTNHVQTGLSSVADWCKSWQVSLKADKCKVFHVSRQKTPVICQYEVCDQVLSTTTEHRHLGIWFEPTLAWNYHVNSTSSKANWILGLIRRTFEKNKVGIKVDFGTLVLPILEYGCQVWNPYLIKHIKALESIRRRATRLICGADKSCEERLSDLILMTLELRRKYLCLVQLYKIILLV